MSNRPQTEPNQMSSPLRIPRESNEARRALSAKEQNVGRPQIRSDNLSSKSTRGALHAPTPCILQRRHASHQNTRGKVTRESFHLITDHRTIQIEARTFCRRHEPPAETCHGQDGTGLCQASRNHVAPTTCARKCMTPGRTRQSKQNRAVPLRAETHKLRVGAGTEGQN